MPGVESLKPGVVRVVIVAWREDDPVVQQDGRFWMRVPGEAKDVLGKPAGTIVAKGQSLEWWRTRADGDEVQTPNPVTHAQQRFSLQRWSDADPKRTHVIVSFEQIASPAGGQGRTIKGAANPPPRRVEIELSDEARRLKAEQAALQQQFRAASDRGDEHRTLELSALLQTISEQLERAAFPHYARGWNVSHAICDDTDQYILDWTTGY